MSIEICKFTAEEIDEALEGLDGLQKIIAPLLKKIDYEGKGDEDAVQFRQCIKIAKHALIAMADFLEKKYEEEY